MNKRPTPKKDALSALIVANAGTENIIAVNRFYVDLTGGLETALLLSQIIYWSDRATMDDGWFAKTYEEWEKEICLSKYQVSKSAKALEKFGVETKVKKFKGSPTVHYRLDLPTLSQSIVKYLTIDSEETSQTITETTTETTKEKDSTARAGTVDADGKVNSYGMHVIEEHGVSFRTEEMDFEVAPEPPKKERQSNPWYDAVASVFDLHGGRNGLMVGLLQGKATKNGHKDYNLETPLTSADDILKFGRWWKANHDGLTMVQAPVKVQSEVMGWQAKGCPDAPGHAKPVQEIKTVYDLMGTV
jgi:hypothetical protein